MQYLCVRSVLTVLIISVQHECDCSNGALLSVYFNSLMRMYVKFVPINLCEWFMYGKFIFIF